jgi:hypothetical protein
MATIKLNNVSIATETAGAAALTVPSIQQTDAQNISGTKASHEMFMGKTFTLTGDLTVNDNLVFANLTGGGADITITDDGNGRTLTTSSAGTLEGGEFLGTVPVPTNISTMTSGAIASGVTFPVGHVLQVKSMTDSVSATTGSTSYVATNTTLAITPSSSSSKILILVHSAIRGDGGSPVAKPQFVIYRGGTALSSYPMAAVMEGDQNGHNSQVSMNWLDSPFTTSSTTYTVYMRDFAGRWVRWASGYPEQTVASMTLMEIAG